MGKLRCLLVGMCCCDCANRVVALLLLSAGSWCCMLSGGYAAGGPTDRWHKNYFRELAQILLTDQTKADPFPKVVASEQDRGKLRTPHDDPLVVELKITSLRVRRILIDIGSSTNIISADCLSKLKFDEKNLVLVHHPIIGSGYGDTAYNVILRQPTLNHVKAVIVTHLLLMKFECDGGQISSCMETSKQLGNVT
ncbi:hypothetical protein BVRB_3g070640 [Beta vulgaris subsp. vulgaris]|uniref:Uncharacterized protein n=1 Tax=Beta vulgaris subsp. vulgaris TaxID=3555 RepID=A0A0J8BCH6_BETVV|nr:hypothetical protein BVRB_3g070640 [Beta vulgaris subsp. vulgaris]